MRWAVWMLLLVLPGWTPSAAAQSGKAEAISIAKAYIDDHNGHDLDAVMAHYHPDATFQLNMGRPLVRGLAAIRELERFDAVARSLLLPYGWDAVPVGGRWEVRVAGVVENSEIFSALGLHIVIAVPQAPVFQLQDGRIIHSEQPPLRAECLAIIQEGFSKTAKWISETRSPLAPALLDGAWLRLEPALLGAIAQQIGAWRAASGWSPKPSDMRACGRIDDEA